LGDDHGGTEEKNIEKQEKHAARVAQQAGEPGAELRSVRSPAVVAPGLPELRLLQGSAGHYGFD